MRTRQSAVLGFAVLLILHPAFLFGQYTVTTVAGGGPNNRPALSACLGDPYTVALDPSGNIFIGSGQILKLNTSGIVSTYKPNGAGPYMGDYVYVGSSGNVYFSSENRIYKVDALTGVPAVVAGTGVAGYSGDGGLATSAELNKPAGVATDTAGDLYIADEWNHVVRKVDASTHIISTIAGTAGKMGYDGDGDLATAALLYLPVSLAVDSGGNIYISDYQDQAVREITASTGIITTLVKNPPLLLPSGIALDSAGNIYIADSANDAVREYVATTSTVQVVAGGNGYGYSGDGGPATSAKLGTPEGVWVDASGNLYIADRDNSAIRKVDATTGYISTVAGGGGSPCGDGDLATNATLDLPVGIALDGSGNLYIADRFDYAIRKVNASTGVITSVASTASIDSRGVAVDSKGNVYYIDSSGLYRVDATTGTSSLYVSGLSGYGLAVDAYDNLFIASDEDDTVKKVDATTAAVSTVASIPGTGVSVDSAGNIFVADEMTSVVHRIDGTTGSVTIVAGGNGFGYTGDGGLATSAQLNYPWDVVVDGAGNLYISDMFNYVVRKVDGTTGVITTVVGTGTEGYSGDGGEALSAEFNYPSGLVASYPDLLITDTENGRVRRVANLLIPPVVPTVTTTAVTNITTTGATSGGTVNADGGASVTERGVCWGTSANPSVGGNCKADTGVGTGTFSIDITGLTPGTLYHVRAYATNLRGTGYGADLQFTTTPVVPTVTTTATVTNITSTTATSGGTVTSEGGDSVTARGVCWGTSANPTTSASCTADGAGAGTFTSSITGLTPVTSYHVRAYATNSWGTAYGADVQFTTLATIPTLTTTTVTNIAATSATSGGTISSDGGASVTARGVCWSLTSNPTTSASCTEDGTGTGAFTSSMTGLTSSTTYHVRAYATNSAGTGYGSDLSFTTAVLVVVTVPTVTTTAVSAITTTTAVSGGRVTSDGNATVTARGVCWSTAANPTTSNTCVSASSGGTGSYTISITGLTAGASYHVRAYAVNSAGTAYGADVSFTTSTGKGPFAYITNSSSYTVSVIDTQTNLIYGKPISVGKMPMGVAVNATGTRVFVANLTGNSVSTIDTSTNTVTGSVSVGYLPFAVALSPVNTMVYTADYTTEDMGYFDSSLSAPTYSGVPMGIGTHPYAVALSPDGSRVYVAESGLDSVAVVDANTHTIIGSAIPVGSGPDALGLSPDGTRLYVANGNVNTLTLIDTTTNTVIGSPITVGNGPSAITFNPAGTLAYVTNFSDNSVSVVDTSTNLAVGNPISVGKGPWGIAMHPAGTFLYVVNYSGNSVSVIDAATQQVTATVTVGSSPAGFGQFILPPLSVVTAAAANLTGSAATAGGNVTAAGGSAVTARGVCWGLTAKPALGGTCKNDTATGTGVFSLNLTGLVASTSYHLRAFATNAYGTAYGADVQFTTGPAAIPTLTTSSVTAITQTSATSGGTITDDGGAQVTARGVCWSSTANPTTSATCTRDGAGTGTFTSSLTALTANTLYHVRAYATNSAGTAYGADVQFTTSSDFQISACSTSLTIRAGGTATCRLSLQSVGRFTGNVALSYSGLPPHSACLILPAHVWLKPSGTAHSMAIIATSWRTPKGTYTLTFTGTTGTPGKAGSAQNSTSVTLIVK